MANKDYASSYQQLFEEIRLLHNRLRWLGDQIHDDMGQTSAKRSLLLSLHREGPCTVPDLARERLVSRQIIQTQINLLLEEGLVTPRANPRHKRSKQMALTRKGRDLVEKMLARESALLEDIGSPLTPSEVAQSAQSLSSIRQHLEQGYK
jgi:DNA-binding MarR family transcriptional regulator